MWTGVHPPYRWLESRTHTLSGLLEACPQALLGRYLAVAACDGEPLIVNADLQREGWAERLDLAYSPRLLSLAHLPSSGYDEWYVFAQPVNLPGLEIFIDLPDFSLSEPRPGEVRGGTRGPGEEQSLQARFWRQLEAAAPLTYLAEGENFLVATKDEALYAAAEAWMQTTRPAT